MMKQTKLCLLNLAIAIAIGAFGAHALKAKISAEALAVFHTGHDYHMWIGLLALIVAAGTPDVAPKLRSRLLLLLLVGTILFSGSLYLYAVTGIKAFAIITPLGGLVWIVSLAAFALSRNQMSENFR